MLKEEVRTNIAALWSAYMGIHFTAKDVMLMQQLVDIGIEMPVPTMGKSKPSALREQQEGSDG